MENNHKIKIYNCHIFLQDSAKKLEKPFSAKYVSFLYTISRHCARTPFLVIKYESLFDVNFMHKLFVSYNASCSDVLPLTIGRYCSSTLFMPNLPKLMSSIHNNRCACLLIVHYTLAYSNIKLNYNTYLTNTILYSKSFLTSRIANLWIPNKFHRFVFQNKLFIKSEWKI